MTKHFLLLFLPQSRVFTSKAYPHGAKRQAEPPPQPTHIERGENSQNKAFILTIVC